MVPEVERTCSCNFTYVFDERFICFDQSPNHVTYRAQINGTLQSPAERLLTFIQQWVASTQSISIEGVQLDIDRTCEPAISTFNDAECTTPSGNVDSTVGIAAGCSVAILLVIGIVIAIIVCIIWKRSVK